MSYGVQWQMQGTSTKPPFWQVLVAARVLVGRYCKGSPGDVEPPVLDERTGDRYDSTVDNAEAPSIFVAGSSWGKLDETWWNRNQLIWSTRFSDKPCFSDFFPILTVYCTLFYIEDTDLIRFVAAGGVNTGATARSLFACNQRIFDFVELRFLCVTHGFRNQYHILCISDVLKGQLRWVWTHQLRPYFEIFRHFLCFWSRSWREMCGRASQNPVKCPCTFATCWWVSIVMGVLQ